MLKLGLGGNGKYGEKNLNPGCILKVEFTGFVDLVFLMKFLRVGWEMT